MKLFENENPRLNTETMDWTDENFKVEEFEYLSIDEIVKEINELTEYVACVIQVKL